jgi:hypothetical protein
MAISYAVVSRNSSGVRQNRISIAVQHEAIEEYRRSLLSAVPHGSLVDDPKLKALRKHVQQGENKVAETTVTLAFGALERGVDIDVVTRPFRVITGMLRAQLPCSNYSLEELHRIETQIEGECNVLQMAYTTGDRSMKVKREMLERFEKLHAIIGQIIAQLRKDLYSGPRR